MGLDLGLEQAGIRIRCALEFDRDCCKTIRLNRPGLPLLERDILNASADEILRAAGLCRGGVDLVCGGPPCQSFSTAGKRGGFKDKRGGVFPRFLDIATDINPGYILVENVRGLWSASKRQKPQATGKDKKAGWKPKAAKKGKSGTALQYIVQHLKDAGYSVTFALYDAANYGVPQNRERIILIACKEGGVPLIPPTHSDEGQGGFKPWITFREAVAALDPNECSHTRFTEKLLGFLRELKEGQNWRNLSEKLQKEAMGGAYASGGGKVGYYRRLAWDRPSPTLLTVPTQKATLLAHPEEDRPLSIEEYRVLQQFPADWRLQGSLATQYKQLGNAVPVGLGAAAGRHLLWWDSLSADDKQQQRITPYKASYSRYMPTDHLAFNGTREKLRKLQRKLNLSRAQTAALEAKFQTGLEAAERSSLDPDNPPSAQAALPALDMPQRDIASPEPGGEAVLSTPALGGVHP